MTIPTTPSADPDAIAIAATVDGFKAAFRDHPAGVALISAATDRGDVGLTASSVASVAVDPPMLSFSVTRATGSAGGLLGADTVVVHLLADHHVDVAKAFAKTGEPRFTPEQQWARLETGEPYLPTARAVLRCRIVQAIPAGSSMLVIAEVLDVLPAGSDAPALLYQNRNFLRLEPTPL
ncbi:MAG TPA: flavin reductase family protein [Plantibacter sp.]|uniref:flavin reductase family protein n=1 Tax=unclassified Plantibacter TaxID=2624265 RepID=UPI002B843A01|nr:flavin reductase family protein [Plantibacter sp.]